jgi:hypothetical protein
LEGEKKKGEQKIWKEVQNRIEGRHGKKKGT